MDWIQPTFGASPAAKRERSELCGAPNLKKKHVSSAQAHHPSPGPEFKIPETQLLVNRKKVAEVRAWLDYALGRSSSSFLVLSGPPGCGKLTSLRSQCRSKGAQLMEWVPPVQIDYSQDHHEVYMSQEQAFDNFVVKGCRYASVLSSKVGSRVIVVKDLPNTFMVDPSKLHALLSKYTSIGNIRIVFVMNDVMLIKKIFSDEVKVSCNVAVITFNALTERTISKALGSTTGKRKNNNHQNVVESISANCGGDLRNAIVTRQFYSVQGVPEAEKSNTVKNNTVELIKNDPFIDIFHGLGRIVYPKWDKGKPVHNPDHVAESFLTCPNLFIGMLEENCPSRFSSIHELSKGMERLAFADLMLADWEGDSVSKALALSTACRGVMLANLNPVKKFQSFSRSLLGEMPSSTSSVRASLMRVFLNETNSEVLADLAAYSKILLPKSENYCAVKELVAPFIIR